jgi:peptidoglycan/xylan/chitin deacetylase (PgdA/CDA1 family)
VVAMIGSRQAEYRNLAGVPILMYHGIGDSASAAFRRFVLTEDAFGSHLDLLVERGYRTLTVSEVGVLLAAGIPVPTPCVALTFDDAFEDFHTCALPALVERGLTGTLYVPTGFVGATARWLEAEGEGDRRLLSWGQLQEAVDSGIECGSHSHTHAAFDSLSRRDALEQARRSRVLLEDRLRQPVRSFAYPSGYWNGRARSAVGEAGFSSACAVGELVASARDHPLALPRLSVNADIGVADLACLLALRPSRAAKVNSAVRRIVWRAGRRLGIWG